MGHSKYSLDDFINVIQRTMANHEDIIFIKDTDLRYQYVNKAFIKVNDIDDPIGKTDFELPDDRDAVRYKSTDLQILETGEEIKYNAVVHPTDGRKSHYLVSKSPVFGPEGEIIGIYGSGRCIDDQIVIQRKLQYNLQLIETLLDSIPYPVFIKNTQGEYIRVNRAYINEIYTTSDNIVGKTDFDIHTSEEAKFFHSKDLQVLRTGVRDSYIIKGSQTGKKYLITKDALHNEKGEIVGLVGIVNLFIDLDEIQEELINNQKIESISKLAGGVAHDLNNILTNITGLSSIMLLDQSNTEIEGDLQTIFKASKEAARLIEKLQTFAQIKPSEMRTTNFCEVVHNVLALVKSNYARSITINEQLVTQELLIRADRSEISQMTINLLMNAIEAVQTKDDPEISISVSISEIDPFTLDCLIRPESPSQGNRFVELSIRDNGSGIDRFDLNKIFDPYFTTKGHMGGTGLGLSIVYGVVSHHDGYLTLNTGRNYGTEFTIYLPML